MNTRNMSAPELGDEFFNLPPEKANKQQLSLRVDADVAEWLKSFGKGYQTMTNAMLRKWMLAHRSRG